ncbi:hypothetical protein niasHS_012815 [Heterodera schachtii]|uniref:RING-type domain-containing protein n=1 Tax=Heterodera schachtii TaxID=97005 RepID=A0ABD2I8Y4_HETSC
MNQLDCFCMEPFYPPPNAPPDERFQAVVLPCCTGVSHFACIARQLRQTAARTAAGVRLGGTCPYCRRRAFAEDAVATERWVALVRQHNKHRPNAAEEELRFMADIVNAPRTPSPPPAAAAAHHHHYQVQAVQRVQGMQQQQQQVQAVQQSRRRTVRDDRRYEIAAIVCSRRAADGQARELRIHWRSFPYRDDTFDKRLKSTRPLFGAVGICQWWSQSTQGVTLRTVDFSDAQTAAAEEEEAMEEEEDHHHQNLPRAPAATPPPQAAEEEGNQIQMEAVPAAVEVILIDDDDDEM